MSNIDKHGLLGVRKHANQHRLSRLTMEVHTGELRIMASAVESYTDELIAALEAAEKRIAETNQRNAELTAKIEPMERQVGELTMWVKRLAHSLRKAKPDSKLHSDAMDYLNRNGLISVEVVLR